VSTAANQTAPAALQTASVQADPWCSSAQVLGVQQAVYDDATGPRTPQQQRPYLCKIARQCMCVCGLNPGACRLAATAQPLILRHLPPPPAPRAAAAGKQPRLILGCAKWTLPSAKGYTRGNVTPDATTRDVRPVALLLRRRRQALRHLVGHRCAPPPPARSSAHR
jgi:hypothetical protein